MSQAEYEPRVAPLCGSCGRTMSPRDNNQWFCAGCVEYGNHVGIIQPVDPDHPQFYRDLSNGGVRKARELLVGKNVEYASYGTRELEHIGEISRIEQTGDSAETLTVFIERERNFPFDRTVNEIRYDRFEDLLHEPSPPAHSDTIEEGQEVLVII